MWYRFVQLVPIGWPFSDSIEAIEIIGKLLKNTFLEYPVYITHDFAYIHAKFMNEYHEKIIEVSTTWVSKLFWSIFHSGQFN